MGVSRGQEVRWWEGSERCNTAVKGRGESIRASCRKWDGVGGVRGVVL